MTPDLAPLIVVISTLWFAGNVAAWFMMVWPAALVYSLFTSALMFWMLESLGVTNLV